MRWWISWSIPRFESWGCPAIIFHSFGTKLETHALQDRLLPPLLNALMVCQEPWFCLTRILCSSRTIVAGSVRLFLRKRKSSKSRGITLIVKASWERYLEISPLISTPVRENTGINDSCSITLVVASDLPSLPTVTIALLEDSGWYKANWNGAFVPA